MADSRHLGKVKKSLYFRNSLTVKMVNLRHRAKFRGDWSKFDQSPLTDRHEIWHDDAARRLTILNVPTVRFQAGSRNKTVSYMRTEN